MEELEFYFVIEGGTDDLFGSYSVEAAGPHPTLENNTNRFCEEQRVIQGGWSLNRGDVRLTLPGIDHPGKAYVDSF
jgi:hypothetical protein